jgi:hypothetical protein
MTHALTPVSVWLFFLSVPSVSSVLSVVAFPSNHRKKIISKITMIPNSIVVA